MRFLITAGPTREFIDPFRYISNPSSGKMGFALAQSARERGQEVVLVSGPSRLAPPVGVKTIFVTSALEMRDEVTRHFPRADVVIMAAAVSDYRPQEISPTKIKKGREKVELVLIKNPDILGELGRKKEGRILVGFSAETDYTIDSARRKMESKNLDLVLANDISTPDSGFGQDTNKVTILDREGKVESLPLLSKKEIADRIIERILRIKNNE